MPGQLPQHGTRLSDVTTRPQDGRVTRAADIEDFWPSRRGHAYDEMCRRSSP